MRERNRALTRDGAREITGCRSLDNAIDQIRSKSTFLTSLSVINDFYVGRLAKDEFGFSFFIFTFFISL